MEKGLESGCKDVHCIARIASTDCSGARMVVEVFLSLIFLTGFKAMQMIMTELLSQEENRFNNTRS